MRRQSAAEFNRLSATQYEAMNDVCNIYSVSFASGTYSTQSIETRTLRYSGTPCGIEFTDGQVYERGQALLVGYDCVLRLSANIDVRQSDEIVLVEKGEFLISGTFKPYKYPTVNSNVQHVQLKRTAT